MPVKLTGMSEMKRRLQSVADRFPTAVEQAIYLEAQIEMTEAKRRTPVWNPANPLPKGHVPGTLRASGHVLEPEREGSTVSVTLAFGGGAAHYAIYVHEDLEAFHATGQAKFLESTLRESTPYMTQRVAKRINLQELVG